MSRKLPAVLTSILARHSASRHNHFDDVKRRIFSQSNSDDQNGQDDRSSNHRKFNRASYYFPVVGIIGAWTGFAIWEKWKGGVEVACEVSTEPGSRDTKSENHLSLQEAVNQSKGLLKNLMLEQSCPGLVITVTVDGKEAWSEGLGLADVENGIPCTPLTVMRIASISKPLTMAAVAKLWEEKKLNLDQPIQYYVPSWPEKYFDGEKVTITTRHLVSMLGGIRNYDKECKDLESNKLKAKEKKKEKDKKKSKSKDKDDDNEKDIKKAKSKDKDDDDNEKDKKKSKSKDKDDDNEKDKKKVKNKDKDDDGNEKDKKKAKNKDKDDDGNEKDKKKSKSRDKDDDNEKDKSKDKGNESKNKDGDKEKNKDKKEKRKHEDNEDKKDKKKYKDKDDKKHKDKEKKDIGEGEKGKKKDRQNDSEFKEFYLQKHWSSVLESLDLFKDDNLCCRPGSEYLYSTHNWTLVSAVVEGASGKKFPQLMKELFKDLGLMNTYLDEAMPIIQNRARYYTMNKKNRLANAPYVDNSYKWAGGGFLSTSGDLCRFGNAMLFSFQAQSSGGGTAGFLRPETVSAIWSPVDKTRCGWDSYGFYGMGWGTVPVGDCPPFTREQRQYFSHTGGAVGASSVLLVLPRRMEVIPTNGGIPPLHGVVVAIIVNMQSVSMNRLALDVAKLFEQIRDV